MTHRTIPLTVRGLAIGAAVACLTPSVTMAQDFERVAPKVPPAQPVPNLAVPDQNIPASQDQSVLVPELRGMMFVPGVESLQPQGVDPAALTSSVDIRGLPLITDPAFVTAVQPYIGRSLSQADLDAIGVEVRKVYLANERPFVDVTVPPQNVANGIVQVVVTEYKVGEISVTGNRHFSSDLVRRYGDLESGDTLTLPHLRRALEGYNQNPFLVVNAITSPGASTGLSNVELQVKDRTPLRVYAGYDNQGVPTLDRDEWYVGFNWGNVLGTGDIFSYQFTRAFNGRYESHSASNVLPVGANDRILLFGAYATQTPRFPELFKSKGHSGQASFRWAHDVRSGQNIDQTVQIGVDYKRTDSNLEFSGFRLLDTAVEVFQIPMTYTATMSDRAGETELQTLVVVSPGNVTGHNSDEDLQQLVPYADSTYIYSRFSLTRTTRLPYEISWIARGVAQVASSNLPYSEQIGGGGIGSVRGYDTNTALGSQGFLVSQEIRLPPFSIFGGKSGGFNDQLQFGVFLDYAWLRQQKQIPDTERTAEMFSVGGNVHYLVERYLDVQVEVGTQLKSPPGTNEKETRAAIIATISY